ncbi:MAG: hypothetical protein ABI907_03860 [Ramlibacter sp.]
MAIHGIRICALGLALAGAGGGALAADLDFDRTFNSRADAGYLHYRATYTQAGQAHQVEVWRDRDLRLKRRTDDRVETLVTKPAGQAEWQMTVLDLKRKIRTDIARTNLMRIGHFTDWFSLSHSLARPSGPYQLSVATRPAGIAPALRPCKWYALKAQDVESRVCWSAEAGLPLLIASSDGKEQWRISHVDKAAPAAQAFAINDKGFVRNNANEDIKTD